MKIPNQLKADMEHPHIVKPPDWSRNKVQQVLLCEPGDNKGCENCGGRGRVFAFYACSGPHRNAASSIQVVSTWIGDSKTGGWYYGEHKSFPCPVCNPDELSWYRIEQGEEFSG